MSVVENFGECVSQNFMSQTIPFMRRALSHSNVSTSMEWLPIYIATMFVLQIY